MPRSVQLLSYDPDWPRLAQREALRIRKALAPVAAVIHHIGSTAAPAMPAKPIIDLLGVVADLGRHDGMRTSLEALGYSWRGENGLVGRCYYCLDDLATGGRRINLHLYAEGHPAIRRHIDFRDWLRTDAEAARQYASIKISCAEAHPDDSRAYSACKAKWIDCNFP